jgi:microcystin-dependent protein
MAQPYVGEIRMFAGNFAPVGWMFCEGQLLSIVENEILFTLIGTTYGGDGHSTFALPDLRGRIPIHQTIEFSLGQWGGAEEITLSTTQIPAHSHAELGTLGEGHQAQPSRGLWATAAMEKPYAAPTMEASLHASSIASTGGGQSHANVQPYFCVNFIISLFGIYPSPT